jgi:hypothetical protein
VQRTVWARVAVPLIDPATDPSISRVSLVDRVSLGLEANVAGEPNLWGRGAAVDAAAVEHVHAEDHNVAGAKVFRDKTRTLVVGQDFQRVGELKARDICVVHIHLAHRVAQLREAREAV